MGYVRLVVAGALAVALMSAASAQERPPMEFAPEEVTRPDGGAPAEATPTPVPQEEDREAAPLPRGSAPAHPVAPPPATTPAVPSAPSKPLAPPPAPKPDKPRRARAPRAPAPPAEPPLPAVPPRITLHVYEPERGNRFDPEETIEAAMGEVLAADARLRFVPLTSMLSPPDEPPRALAAADVALAEALKAYETMDLALAKTRLEVALKSYQKYLPALAARPGGVAPMRDGFIALSKARFFEGNLDGARDALRYAFVLDGTVRWDKTLFPAQMKKLVMEARLLFETMGAGKLSIDSDPQGARVWLNGVPLSDRTPASPIDAPNGPNFISYARRGWAPVTQAFEVAGGNEEAHALAALQRYPKNPLAPIDRARAHVEDAPAPASLKEACAELGVDLLLLVRAARPGERDDEQPAVVTAYLYDARPARIINRLEMKVEGDLPATARVLARELLRGVRLDGVWRPALAAPRPKLMPQLWAGVRNDWGRFRHWKGFWYVVGGVAAAVVAGTVVGATAYGNSRAVATDAVILGGH